MATAAPDVEIWKAVIVCEDDEKSKTYKLPIDTTVGEIKARWADDVGASADVTVFMTADDEVLSNSQALGDIGEIAPAKKAVNIFVEETTGLLFEVYKAPDGPRRVAALLTQRPEELHRVLRDVFRLGEERLFRLRTQEAPLKYNLSLGEQGVDADTLLLIDLAFELQLREPWSDMLEELLLYSSEECDQLRSADDTNPQRLMCGRQDVDTGGDVIDGLMPLGALTRTAISLELHVVKDITILINGRFTDRWVWPTDRLDKIIPNRQSKKPSMTLDGRLLPKSAMLCDADVADHSLFHSDSVSVSVKCSDGRREVVRVPLLGAVSDIVAELRKKEGSEDFSLRRGTRILDKNETIGQAGIAEGDKVEVQRRSVTLTVTLSDRCVRWSTEAESLTFTDVVNVLAAKSGIELERLRHKEFRCAGCQRRINKAEEEFQVIPAPCCRVRSLTLEEPTEPATSDAGTQALSRSRRAGAPRKGVSARPETADRRSQTRTLRHDAGTQTDGARKEIGVQAAQQRAPFAHQHPPPPPPPRPFLIWDWTRGGLRSIPCDLQLPDRPTVGSVRAAVGRQLGLEPREVELERYFGRRGGAEVVQVCGADGRLSLDFGDAAGTVWAWGDVKQQQRRLLHDDAADFAVVPGRRNIVFADRRSDSCARPRPSPARVAPD